MDLNGVLLLRVVHCLGHFSLVLISDNGEFLYILFADDPEAAYVHHRSFLNEHVVFKEVHSSDHPLPSIGKEKKCQLVEMLVLKDWPNELLDVQAIFFLIPNSIWHISGHTY